MVSKQGDCPMQSVEMVFLAIVSAHCHPNTKNRHGGLTFSACRYDDVTPEEVDRGR